MCTHLFYLSLTGNFGIYLAITIVRAATDEVAGLDVEYQLIFSRFCEVSIVWLVILEIVILDVLNFSILILVL